MQNSLLSNSLLTTPFVFLPAILQITVDAAKEMLEILTNKLSSVDARATRQDDLPLFSEVPFCRAG